MNPELNQIEIRGMTRSAFLVRSALAAGAAYGTAAVTPFTGRALAQGSDLDILNYALTLEFLEAAFYTQGVRRAGLSGSNLALAKELRDNETEHVDALTRTIRSSGGKPVAAPEVDFGEAFKDEKSFLDLAVTLEDTGVSAYNGAAPKIQLPEVLAAAGSIVQIEARHAALVRLANDATPVPEAFDEPLEQDAVLKAVQPFIKS